MQTAHDRQTAKQQVALPGKVIMQRYDDGYNVEMIYWGVASNPMITINVRSEEKLSFKLIPPLDDVMDWYNHPFGYQQHYSRILTEADVNVTN